MKKVLAVAVIALAVALISAGTAMARIANSKHDLSSGSAATIKASQPSLSACQFCHTPHLGTAPVVDGAPLWNRSLGTGGYNAPGGGTYQVYGAGSAGTAGQTLAGTAVNAPGTNSKTCLSCHDGTLSLGDVLVGTDVTTFTDYTPSRLTGGNRLTGGPSALGTDLRQEHPVGLTATPGRAGVRPIADMTAAGARFYGGTNQMECATCHDPHSDDWTANTAYSPFLRMDRTTICTDCHDY